MIRITGTTPVTVGGVSGANGPRGLRITTNNALTGTITVADERGTQAIITNPPVLGAWEGYGFTGITTVTSSNTCDLSVSILNR